MSVACPDGRPCPAGAEADDRRLQPLQRPRAGAVGREVAAVKNHKTAISLPVKLVRLVFCLSLSCPLFFILLGRYMMDGFSSFITIIISYILHTAYNMYPRLSTTRMKINWNARTEGMSSVAPTRSTPTTVSFDKAHLPIDWEPIYGWLDKVNIPHSLLAAWPPVRPSERELSIRNHTHIRSSWKIQFSIFFLRLRLGRLGRKGAKRTGRWERYWPTTTPKENCRLHARTDGRMKDGRYRPDKKSPENIKEREMNRLCDK